MRGEEAARVRKEKVVMIGPAGCGKTAITNRIIQDTFRENSAATVGAAFFAKKVTVNGIDLRLDIWDTGGSEKFRSLAPMYYREARAAVVVFDLTSSLSLSQAHAWVEELRNNGRKDAVLIGAGNKLDLEDQRVITPSEVQDFQFQHQLDYCVEVSAKSGANITTLFAHICDGLTKLQPLDSPETQLTGDYLYGTPSPSKCDC
jgi:small GTP-binding protein